MEGKGKTAMSHNGFKRTLLSVYDWFSKNDVQHSATGSRILGRHVLKKLSAINEYFSASDDNEIADKADEIAMELYNKEWSKLPHDQQDDVMQLASDEVMGVGIENAE
jgi:hypothetical protein